MENQKESIRGALARGYCTKRNGKKVLDSDLIEDMAKEIEDLLAGDDTAKQEENKDDVCMKKIGKFNLIDENECELKCNCGWNIMIGGKNKEDLKKLKKIIKKEFTN